MGVLMFRHWLTFQGFREAQNFILPLTSWRYLSLSLSPLQTSVSLLKWEQNSIHLWITQKVKWTSLGGYTCGTHRIFMLLAGACRPPPFFLGDLLTSAHRSSCEFKFSTLPSTWFISKSQLLGEGIVCYGGKLCFGSSWPILNLHIHLSLRFLLHDMRDPLHCWENRNNWCKGATYDITLLLVS